MAALRDPGRRRKDFTSATGDVLEFAVYGFLAPILGAVSYRRRLSGRTNKRAS